MPQGPEGFSKRQLFTVGAAVTVLVAVAPYLPEIELSGAKAAACIVAFSVACAAAQALWSRLVPQSAAAALPRAMFVPRPFTEEDLQWYDGQRNSRAARTTRMVAGQEQGPNAHPLPEYDDLVFMAVKGVVYNVAPGWYGPSSAYAAFAGRDSSRQLGKVIVSSAECNADWTLLSGKHKTVLDDWEKRLHSKYVPVGWLVPGSEYFTRTTEFSP
jgi:hypothetical protein